MSGQNLDGVALPFGASCNLSSPIISGQMAWTLQA
jgi:hypothetical protein